MTKDQKRLLDRRLREATARQPDLLTLKNLLLGFDGRHLVAPPDWESDLTSLICAGFMMAGPVVHNVMATNECHRNVAQVWIDHQHELVGIGTGYALSEDGLWRQHTWGVRREGLLETTAPREKYFGILLQHANADSFAKIHLSEATFHVASP